MKEYSKRERTDANDDCKKKKTIFMQNAHEEWAKKNGYRETSNEELHSKNTERFVNDAER